MDLEKEKVARVLVFICLIGVLVHFFSYFAKIDYPVYKLVETVFSKHYEWVMEDSNLFSITAAENKYYQIISPFFLTIGSLVLAVLITFFVIIKMTELEKCGKGIAISCLILGVMLLVSFALENMLFQRQFNVRDSLIELTKGKVEVEQKTNASLWYMYLGGFIGGFSAILAGLICFIGDVAPSRPAVVKSPKQVVRKSYSTTVSSQPKPSQPVAKPGSTMIIREKETPKPVTETRTPIIEKPTEVFNESDVVELIRDTTGFKQGTKLIVVDDSGTSKIIVKQMLGNANYSISRDALKLSKADLSEEEKNEDGSVNKTYSNGLKIKITDHTKK